MSGGPHGFMVGAGHQKEQGLIRNMELSAPLTDLPGRGGEQGAGD